jgi:hypothetical protein
MRKHINYELINKLAGCGPDCTARLNRENLDRLADPVVPLSERIRLLQRIIGGPLHYEDVADCLGENKQQVFVTKMIMGERPRANVIAVFYYS